MKTIKNACPRCGSLHTKKNGTTLQDKQRYRCKECGRQFLFALDYSYEAYSYEAYSYEAYSYEAYSYEACNPLCRRLIVRRTLNGSGIRDIARTLEISSTTVLKVLRQSAEQTPEPTPPKRIQNLEIDEQWSFVQRKKQQNWLWYALDRQNGEIIAFVLGRRIGQTYWADVLGRRTDASCKKLIQKLTPCQVQNFYTNHWKSYPKFLNAKQHHIGKDGTQNIERKNLNFRTHLKRLQRRTICFSKSKQIQANPSKCTTTSSNSTSTLSIQTSITSDTRPN